MMSRLTHSELTVLRACLQENNLHSRTKNYHFSFFCSGRAFSSRISVGLLVGVTGAPWPSNVLRFVPDPKHANIRVPAAL